MPEPLKIRDEILEVLYWMRGEGLGDDVRPDDLRAFVGAAPEETLEHLEALAAQGLLERRPGAGGTAYRLTEEGGREAGRRFVESFAEMLGQGHGTACAPGCECESLDHPAADCPTHGHRHAHR